ncbi:MAG: hypothetical protein WBA97_34600 [Actinophytocola sp.]|uniref:hypothetical protein n=1 Tax=Actinophytocola sp. TaxID=1872138 RepID=UPI003C73BE8C
MTGPQLLAADLLAAAAAAPEPVLPWRLFAAETVTGRIIEDIPLVGTPQWNYGINQAGALQVTVPIGAIHKQTLRALLDYWRISWGLSWGSHIFQAGPVVTSRFNDAEGPPTLSVGAAGIWSLFTTKRVLANPAWVGTNLAAAEADVNLTSLSLHTIAKRLVQNDMTRNGSLPIVLPADIAGTAERTYPGYDMAYVGERLAQLTQVIDGPEVEFRPEYTDDTRTAIRWKMRIGNPRLGNLGLPHAWDYGRGALTHVDEDSDGSQQQFRVWARGNGMERSLLYGYHADTSLVAAGWPQLDGIDNDHSSATETATLNGWARADVETYRTPVVKLAARIRLDGRDGRGQATGSPAVSEVEVGDNAAFNVRDHRWLPDGEYGQRIIGVSSGGDFQTAQLTLQGA